MESHSTPLAARSGWLKFIAQSTLVEPESDDMKPYRSLALAALLLAPVTAVAQQTQGYAPEAIASGDITETATAAGAST